jgi:hypothetical protein
VYNHWMRIRVEKRERRDRVCDINREGHEGVHSGSGIGHGERNGLSGDTRDACEDSRSLQKVAAATFQVG